MPKTEAVIRSFDAKNKKQSDEIVVQKKQSEEVVVQKKTVRRSYGAKKAVRRSLIPKDRWMDF